MHSRRSFFQSAAALLATTALPHPGTFAAQTTSSALDLSIFTKHLQGIPTEQLGTILAELGVTGIEAPIRPGGHIEPGAVEDELPKFVETLRKYGVRITLLTSAINSVSAETRTEPLLRTAKALGIPKYRLNWYGYNLQLPLWPQLDALRPKLKELVALSKEIGILPCYQNHSGVKMVGAGIWDMALLMRDYTPAELSWSFDIMHATIEGSTSWPTEVALVSDRIGMAVFKNFAWEGKGHRPAALGEGVVGKPYVDQLKKLGYAGPVCLHVEHLKGKASDPAYLKAAIEATKRDIAVLREWWA